MLLSWPLYRYIFRSSFNVPVVKSNIALVTFCRYGPETFMQFVKSITNPSIAKLLKLLSYSCFEKKLFQLTFFNWKYEFHILDYNKNINSNFWKMTYTVLSYNHKDREVFSNNYTRWNKNRFRLRALIILRLICEKRYDQKVTVLLIHITLQLPLYCNFISKTKVACKSNCKFQN